VLDDAGESAGHVSERLACLCHQRIEADLPQQILGIDVVRHWVLILIIRRPCVQNTRTILRAFARID
jgi:hypothetical protein